MASFSYAHTIETPATPAALWRLYADPDTWPTWDPDAERVTLDGPFRTGSGGTMKLTGQDPLTYTLEDVEPERRFVDVTEVPGATIRFGTGSSRTAAASGSRTSCRSRRRSRSRASWAR